MSYEGNPKADILAGISLEQQLEDMRDISSYFDASVVTAVDMSGVIEPLAPERIDALNMRSLDVVMGIFCPNAKSLTDELDELFQTEQTTANNHTYQDEAFSDLTEEEPSTTPIDFRNRMSEAWKFAKTDHVFAAYSQFAGTIYLTKHTEDKLGEPSAYYDITVQALVEETERIIVQIYPNESKKEQQRLTNELIEKTFSSFVEIAGSPNDEVSELTLSEIDEIFAGNAQQR